MRVPVVLNFFEILKKRLDVDIIFLNSNFFKYMYSLSTLKPYIICRDRMQFLSMYSIVNIIKGCAKCALYVNVLDSDMWSVSDFLLIIGVFTEITDSDCSDII